jgi:hypothetical protein
MEEPQEVVAARIVRDLLGAGSSNATIQVNAGGAGLWVAVTCCAVMLAANLFLAAIVMDHSRKIDDLGDYLAAIYAQAPQLKPEDSK